MGLSKKVSVTKPTAKLWCEVLFSEMVMVPEWEVGKSPDIAELLDKGLVKVSGGSPSKLLSLADSSMELSVEEKKTLLIVRMSRNEPLDIGLLMSWAKSSDVLFPLRAIRRLIELDLLELDEEKKVLLARFGAC